MPFLLSIFFYSQAQLQIIQLCGMTGEEKFVKRSIRKNMKSVSNNDLAKLFAFQFFLPASSLQFLKLWIHDHRQIVLSLPAG